MVCQLSPNQTPFCARTVGSLRGCFDSLLTQTLWKLAVIHLKRGLVGVGSSVGKCAECYLSFDEEVTHVDQNALNTSWTAFCRASNIQRLKSTASEAVFCHAHNVPPEQLTNYTRMPE